MDPYSGPKRIRRCLQNLIALKTGLEHFPLHAQVGGIEVGEPGGAHGAGDVQRDFVDPARGISLVGEPEVAVSVHTVAAADGRI